ncbi:MAG: hypothetical protein ACLFTR_03330, partial [Candidatus Woesearchaeota archaeon]
MVQPEKDENRFLRFFRKNKNVVPRVRNFLIFIGMIVVILILIETFLRITDDGKVPYETEYDFRYHPYTAFSTALRETENPCMSDNPDENLDIHVYGGSTTWGLYVEPNETFPSRLSEFLCDEGINVNVTNYGQVAFMNSQEMISFIFELKRGNVPDIVIFYDGVNEFFSDNPEAPTGYNPCFAKPKKTYIIEVLNYHMRDMMTFSKTMKQVENMLRLLGLQNWMIKNDIADIDYFRLHSRHTQNLTCNPRLYATIANNYLSNVRLIKSLEDDYGFRAFFYWQPHLATKAEMSDE